MAEKYEVDAGTGPHETRMKAMLEGILAAEEMQAVPVLSIETSGASEGDRAAFADLVEEGLVRASTMQKTWGGWMLRQLRVTQDGRRWLKEQADKAEDASLAIIALNPAQLRQVERVTSAVAQLLEEHEGDLPAPAAATLRAQHQILLEAPRGNNDVPLVRRSLQLIAAAAAHVTGNVAANLISERLSPLVSEALALF